MNAKTYLRQYKELEARVRRYRERIEQIETLKGIDLDGMPRGTSLGDPTKNAALNLALLKESLGYAIIEAEETRQRIASLIEKMKDPKHKELLYSRYLLLLPWTEVVERLNIFRPGREYELKHIIGYMHMQALKEFEEIMGE